MADLKDIVGYLWKNYPLKDELSDARMTKMVYLADWKAALDEGRQISNINWRFNHYGPYVEDIKQLVMVDADFTLETTNNMYGGYKKLITVRRDFPVNSLSAEEKGILNHVIDMTSKLTWDGFIKLVYSMSTIAFKLSNNHSLK